MERFPSAYIGGLRCHLKGFGGRIRDRLRPTNDQAGRLEGDLGLKAAGLRHHTQ